MNAQGRPDLLVVGAGLIGTSVALAARATGRTVWLHDADPDALAVATARGAGMAGLPDTDPELVVVAVPPSAVGGVISTLMHSYLNTTFTDVSSIKTRVIVEVEAIGCDLTRFVPGHPLAGGEVAGPHAARADLFADRVWVLTPGATVPPGRVRSVAELAAALGAVVVQQDPAVHDRAVALTSHLPQLVSSVLAARLAAPGAADPGLSGQGLRDMTRIAGSDPGLWTQILAANAAPVAEVLGDLVTDLDAVLAALRELSVGADAAAPRSVVTDALVRGNRGRALVPGKHGATATSTVSLVVAVADRPGELARLFAAAGETGVNLEDVRIDHALGRPTGLVELTVSSEQRDRLTAALRHGGWDVRD